MIYKHWMHKQQDPWVLFLRCYQHLTGEVSLPPRKNPSKGSIVQSYAKFWQRTSFSLHHAMKLAGLKHSREVSQEVGCESEDLNRHDSAGGRERVSSMERLDLNVSQRPACQKPGCQSGTIRWSNPGEAEPSGRYLEHWKGLKVDGMTPVSPSLPSAPQSEGEQFYSTAWFYQGTPWHRSKVIWPISCGLDPPRQWARINLSSL